MKQYCIIFDTNVLFRTYDRYADFKHFSFSETLSHMIEEIETRDIYDLFTILIPTIVWKEMRQHSIENYYEKLSQLKDKHDKIKFPFHTFTGEDKDYEKFLDNQIKEYKKALKARMIAIENLPLPTRDCYSRLIKRAYDKRPPFEGKDKKSDKGFKDALLWESILQYKKTHLDQNIILYTNDMMFNDELKQEYLQLFNEEILFIKAKTEPELIQKLSELALEKDATFPIPDNDDFIDIQNYVYNDNFIDELKKFEKNIIGNNECRHIVAVNITMISSIDEPTFDDKNAYTYTISVQCRLTIDGDNEPLSSEIEKDLTLLVESFDNKQFFLTNVKANETNATQCEEIK